MKVVLVSIFHTMITAMANADNVNEIRRLEEWKSNLSDTIPITNEIKKVDTEYAQ